MPLCAAGPLLSCFTLLPHASLPALVKSPILQSPIHRLKRAAGLSLRTRGRSGNDGVSLFFLKSITCPRMVGITATVMGSFAMRPPSARTQLLHGFSRSKRASSKIPMLPCNEERTKYGLVWRSNSNHEWKQRQLVLTTDYVLIALVGHDQVIEKIPLVSYRAILLLSTLD